MNEPILGRRKILTRFGLGILGAGVAIACSSNNKSPAPNVPQATEQTIQKLLEV